MLKKMLYIYRALFFGLTIAMPNDNAISNKAVGADG